jgi:hypothetical protein
LDSDQVGRCRRSKDCRFPRNRTELGRAASTPSVARLDGEEGRSMSRRGSNSGTPEAGKQMVNRTFITCRISQVFSHVLRIQ